MMIAIISRIITITFLFVFTSSPSYSRNAAKELNVVKMEIYRNGKLIGKPAFIMEVGGYAISTHTGDEGYSVRVKLDRAANRSPTMRTINTELYSINNGRWVLSGHPVISTALNIPSDVSMSGAAGADMSIKVVVEENAQEISSGISEQQVQ